MKSRRAVAGWVCFAITLLALGAAVPLASGASGSTTTTQGASLVLAPVADSYVAAELIGGSGTGGLGQLNYGNSTQLNVGFQSSANESVVSTAYLEFSLVDNGSPLSPSSVSSATLDLYVASLYASNSTSVPVVAYSAASTPWKEATITYDNAPKIQSSLATTPVGANSTYYQWDVTAAVRLAGQGGNVTVAVGVTVVPGQEDHVLFNSREAAADPPQLVLQLSQPLPSSSPPPLYLTAAVVAIVLVAIALLERAWSRPRSVSSSKREAGPSL